MREVTVADTASMSTVETDNAESEVRRRRGAGADRAKAAGAEQFDVSLMSNFFTPPAVADYGSAANYAEVCRHYLQAYTAWYWLCMMRYNTVPAVSGAQSPAQEHQQPSAQQPLVPSPPRVVRIASFGKRLLAEAIDATFGFVLKIAIVWLLVDREWIDVDRYERVMAYEADVATLIDVTQELFPLELGTKLIIVVIEALCISYGALSLRGGCTPGKLLLGLRVVRGRRLAPVSAAYGPRSATSDMVELHEYDERVPFAWSLLRSLIKNLTIGFLFPLCIMQYAFRYNRALYDVLCNTVVIDTS